MASVLELPLDELGELAVNSPQKISISSICTVFAKSEVVSHIHGGAQIDEIAAGICETVASKVVVQASEDHRSSEGHRGKNRSANTFAC